MIKYVMAASALKIFSSTPQMRKAYRKLGNTLGQKKRVKHGLNDMYLERARKMLELCKQYDIIQPGDRLLEIGTGWLHRESTVLRLFYDVEITLFDVWDNRQLAAYQSFFSQFEQVMDKELNLDPVQSERAHTLLKRVLAAQSFEEIYSVLNFRYVVNPTGSLEQFPKENFALILSCSVLEHVDRGILPAFIHDYSRLLKPSGHAVDLIDLQDHLYYYDKSVSYKNYLRYSDAVWKRYFQNEVQYFNRVQRSEWLDFYQKAGLVLLADESSMGDPGPITLAESYKHLNQQDLRCMTMWAIHKKL